MVSTLGQKLFNQHKHQSNTSLLFIKIMLLFAFKKQLEGQHRHYKKPLVKIWTQISLNSFYIFNMHLHFLHMLHYLLFGESRSWEQESHFGKWSSSTWIQTKFHLIIQPTCSFLHLTCTDWGNVGGSVCKDSFRISVEIIGSTVFMEGCEMGGVSEGNRAEKN